MRLKGPVDQAFIQSSYKDGFLWEVDQAIPVVRDRSEMPVQWKKLEYIAPEEIDAAIERSIQESFGLPPEDVASSACRLLGFARVTEDMREIIEKRQKKLLAEGRLIRRGDALILAGGEQFAIPQ